MQHGQVLATSDNRTALADLSGQWIDRIHERKPPKWITLDMDSSVSPTHGTQEDTAWNGHFGCMCYHPLFVFNISLVILNAALCGPAMCTVRMVGKTF